MTYTVLAAKLYIIVYGLDIKKQYWGIYYIVQIKLHQYKHYKMDRIAKHKINKYEKSKDRISKYWHLSTFRKSYHYCNIKSGNMMLNL